jgi:hypothetical protein
MREFFIQIKDGQPFEHPIARENMQQLFPQHDLDITIPDNFAVFERKQPPLTGPYTRVAGQTYDWVDGIVTDIFTTRDLTADEKFAQQESVKINFDKHVGFKSWVFDEELCTMKPPIPYPGNQDGSGPRYKWDETTLEWVDITDQPVADAQINIAQE